jgi:hypothetical protein
MIFKFVSFNEDMIYFPKMYQTNIDNENLDEIFKLQYSSDCDDYMKELVFWRNWVDENLSNPASGVHKEKSQKDFLEIWKLNCNIYPYKSYMIKNRKFDNGEREVILIEACSKCAEMADLLSVMILSNLFSSHMEQRERDQVRPTAIQDFVPEWGASHYPVKYRNGAPIIVNDHGVVSLADICKTPNANKKAA